MAGISGDVDMDECYRDFPAEIKGKPRDTESIDEVAHEVLAGKWGNGLSRRKQLKLAGYDYDAVQKRVNELLKK